MRNDLTLVFLGVVASVIAALIVEWINRTLNSSARTANAAAWSQTVYACALPNLNLRPENPASAYPTGAPVTNYRSVQRIGALEVPVQ